MNGFFMVLGMLLGGVLQAVLPTTAWLGGMRPPILLSLTLYYALTREQVPLGAAWTAGLVQDALGMLPLGVSSLCFCGVALLVSRFRREVFAGEWGTHVAFGGVLAGLTTAALYLMLNLSVPSDDFQLPASRVALKILAAVALGAVWAPAVCIGMARIERALGFTEVRDA